MHFVESNGILYSGQFGFRIGHSTEHAILALTQHIDKGLNAGKFTAIVALDFQKAFDRVHKTLLQNKLLENGIDTEWFQSYLSDRNQITKLKDATSTNLSTILGVPQRSILGPALFVIFINDLNKVLNYCKIILFADDNYLLNTGFVEDSNEVINQINHDLAQI